MRHVRSITLMLVLLIGVLESPLWAQSLQQVDVDLIREEAILSNPFWTEAQYPNGVMLLSDQLVTYQEGKVRAYWGGWAFFAEARTYDDEGWAGGVWPRGERDPGRDYVKDWGALVLVFPHREQPLGAFIIGRREGDDYRSRFYLGNAFLEAMALADCLHPSSVTPPCSSSGKLVAFESELGRDAIANTSWGHIKANVLP